MGIGDKIKGLFTYTEEDDEIETVETVTNKKNDSLRQSLTEVPKSNKVVNIHATTQLQVVLVKPEVFEDASAIADHLNEKRTVVLNLENTGKEISRRLIDFLSGVAYANGGKIQRVAHSTYLITPYNVGIMGDLLDELESSGLF